MQLNNNLTVIITIYIKNPNQIYSIKVNKSKMNDPKITNMEQSK